MIRSPAQPEPKSAALARWVADKKPRVSRGRRAANYFCDFVAERPWPVKKRWRSHTKPPERTAAQESRAPENLRGARRFSQIVVQRGRAATKGRGLISTRRRLPKVWYAALRMALTRQNRR